MCLTCATETTKQGRMHGKKVALEVRNICLSSNFVYFCILISYSSSIGSFVDIFAFSSAITVA